MILKNNRHERFAQLLAEGKSQADAYREVFPASRRWKGNAVHVKASEMAGKVMVRIQELQQAVAEKVTITRVQALNIMADVLKTPICDVTDRSLLYQEYTIKDDTVVVKMVSKIAAFQELAKALGWYAPEKQDHTHRFQPHSRVRTLLEDSMPADTEVRR